MSDCPSPYQSTSFLAGKRDVSLVSEGRRKKKRNLVQGEIQVAISDDKPKLLNESSESLTNQMQIARESVLPVQSPLAQTIYRPLTFIDKCH